MNDTELRLECIRQAAGIAASGGGADVLSLAKDLYDWVSLASNATVQAQFPRQDELFNTQMRQNVPSAFNPTPKA